jgi:hypothetical protein
MRSSIWQSIAPFPELERELHCDPLVAKDNLSFNRAATRRVIVPRHQQSRKKAPEPKQEGDGGVRAKTDHFSHNLQGCKRHYNTDLMPL